MSTQATSHARMPTMDQETIPLFAKDGGAGLHLGNQQKSKDKQDEPEGPRIRCPRCRWEPKRHDRWMCHCSHTWNTFDTHGKCPACQFQWTKTMCLACHQWSEHIDWYEPKKRT